MATYRTWTIGPVSLAQASAQAEAASSSSKCCESGQRSATGQLIPVRVWESDAGWSIEADIPGIDPQQVSVEFFQNRLTISYQRLADQSQKSTYDNRLYGDFQRVIRVSDDVQSDAIAARSENGILSIFLPKSGQNAPKKIVVSGP